MIASRARARRGSLLVWMAVILFVFVIIVSLVIDWGLVLADRRQMQAAVNSSARDAVRGEDLSTETYGERFTGTPIFAANVENDLSGDQVRGTYQSVSADHQETHNYQRTDFDAGAFSPDAILVRLRKTGEIPNENVSSPQPRRPYLFRQGVAFDSNTTAGVAIRATAIAQARPALAVGVPNAASEIQGVSTWAVSLDTWLEGWSPSAEGIESRNYAWPPADLQSPAIGSLSPSAMQVGDELALQFSDPTPDSFAVYLPIYQVSVSQPLTIVGFGWLAGYELGAGQVTLRRYRRAEPLRMVAPRNASAQLFAKLQNADAANFVLADVASSALASSPLLRAPALVRATTIPTGESNE